MQSERIPRITAKEEFIIKVQHCVLFIYLFICFIYIYLTQNKMNLFVLSGHGSESFAAFLNGVILQQQKNAAVITAAVITTHHESKLRFK